MGKKNKNQTAPVSNEDIIAIINEVNRIDDVDADDVHITLTLSELRRIIEHYLST